MIVGNGMIANVFSAAKFEEAIIFCSGVSNSSETRISEFHREKETLKSINNGNKRLIYFSSYFAGVDSYCEIPYYKHKRSVESYIACEFDRYTILRLPQVVGNSKNPNTLTNHIFTKLNNGELINIKKNVYRNLLDVDFIYRVVKYILDFDLFNMDTIEIIAPVQYSVEDIVDNMEIVLGKKANRNFVIGNEESFPLILNEEVQSIFEKLGEYFGPTYLYDILFKYYGGRMV